MNFAPRISQWVWNSCAFVVPWIKPKILEVIWNRWIIWPTFHLKCRSLSQIIYTFNFDLFSPFLNSGFVLVIVDSLPRMCGIELTFHMQFLCLCRRVTELESAFLHATWLGLCWSAPLCFAFSPSLPSNPWWAVALCQCSQETLLLGKMWYKWKWLPSGQFLFMFVIYCLFQKSHFYLKGHKERVWMKLSLLNLEALTEVLWYNTSPRFTWDGFLYRKAAGHCLPSRCR